MDVTALPTILLQDLTLQEGSNAVFFVGREKVSEVKVNGTTLDESFYSLKNGVLTIEASVFKLGENSVELSGGLTATVTVEQLNEVELEEKDTFGCNSSLGGSVLVPIALSVGLLLRRKRYGNDD